VIAVNFPAGEILLGGCRKREVEVDGERQLGRELPWFQSIREINMSKG